MRKETTRGVALVIATAMLLSAGPTRAQPIADFYRGKTLRMLIGYGPGGGYDLYARLVAEFLPRHLPGQSDDRAAEHAGGGSFVAAKYMSEVAPKDGTVFGSLAQTLALDSMVNPNAKLDVAKMPYIGRVVTNIDTGAALPKERHQVVRGCAREAIHRRRVGRRLDHGAVSVRAQRLWRRQVQDRARLQGHHRHPAGDGARRGRYRRRLRTSRHAGQPSGLGQQGEAVILYQASLKRHRLLPNVPTLPELAQRRGPRACCARSPAPARSAARS